MQDKAFQDVYNEILAALGELYPERQDHHRSMARSLAEEYMRERSRAMQDLLPKHPEAPPTEQMIFDEEYSKMQDASRRQARMDERLKREQRKEKADARKYALPKPGQAMPRMPSVSYSPPRPDQYPNQPAIPRSHPGAVPAAALNDFYKPKSLPFRG